MRKTSNLQFPSSYLPILEVSLQCYLLPAMDRATFEQQIWLWQLPGNLCASPQSKNFVERCGNSWYR